MESSVVARNRKARHDYFIIETVEAGMVLTGTEIKSVRSGKINLKDGYAKVQGSEVWLYNVHISPFEQGTYYNHEPLRPRKLLLHKREIRKLYGKTREKGLALVPLRLYFKNGMVKVEIGVGKGKKMHDRREDIKQREERRSIARDFKSKRIKV